MKKLASIIVFAFIAPSVFAAPQVLMSTDGPGARGMIRNEGGGSNRNVGGSRTFDDKPRAPAAAPAPAPAATPSHAEIAAAERARAKAREARLQAQRAEADRESLRIDRENQEALERFAQSAEIFERRVKPDEFQKGLRLRGQAVPLPESESQPRRDYEMPARSNNMSPRKPME